MDRITADVQAPVTKCQGVLAAAELSTLCSWQHVGSRGAQLDDGWLGVVA
jgi:hypothetical protein